MLAEYIMPSCWPSWEVVGESSDQEVCNTLVHGVAQAAGNQAIKRSHLNEALLVGQHKEEEAMGRQGKGVGLRHQ